MAVKFSRLRKDYQKPTFEVDRHDFDHVEIKLGFNEPTEYDVDIFLFAPPTLGLSHKNPKIEFLESMKSYVRLQTNLGLGSSAEGVSADQVLEEAQALEKVLQGPPSEVLSRRRAIQSTAGHTKLISNRRLKPTYDGTLSEIQRLMNLAMPES